MLSNDEQKNRFKVVKLTGKGGMLCREKKNPSSKYSKPAGKAAICSTCGIEEALMLCAELGQAGTEVASKSIRIKESTEFGNTGNATPGPPLRLKRWMPSGNVGKGFPRLTRET